MLQPFRSFYATTGLALHGSPYAARWTYESGAPYVGVITGDEQCLPSLSISEVDVNRIQDVRRLCFNGTVKHSSCPSQKFERSLGDIAIL